MKNFIREFLAVMAIIGAGLLLLAIPANANSTLNFDELGIEEPSITYEWQHYKHEWYYDTYIDYTPKYNTVRTIAEDGCTLFNVTYETHTKEVTNVEACGQAGDVDEIYINYYKNKFSTRTSDFTVNITAYYPMNTDGYINLYIYSDSELEVDNNNLRTIYGW